MADKWELRDYRCILFLLLRHKKSKEYQFKEPNLIVHTFPDL